LEFYFISDSQFILYLPIILVLHTITRHRLFSVKNNKNHFRVCTTLDIKDRNLKLEILSLNQRQL